MKQQGKWQIVLTSVFFSFISLEHVPAYLFMWRQNKQQ